MLFALLAQVTFAGPASVCAFSDSGYIVDAGHPVFTISGDHDVAKCLPALRDAVMAARAAWAPRPPKPNADGSVSWSYSSAVLPCSYVEGSGWVQSACCGVESAKRLRCRADELDAEKKLKDKQAARIAEAIVALAAVDKACGEMK